MSIQGQPLIDQVLEAISEKSGLPISSALKSELKGYSGDKLIGVLQRLAKVISEFPDTCYCEVGVFRGLTLLSVSGSNPELPCYGIDNFSQFDKHGENEAHVRGMIERYNIANAHIVDLDFEEALEKFSIHASDRKIGLFFIDGPHDYRSQMVCLLMAKKILRRGAVIVVDDSNYAHVRQANKDFLFSHGEFKLAFESYTNCHPDHMNSEERALAEAGWWNGVNIIVHDPDDVLEPMHPPTDSDKTSFFNEHILHAHGYAQHAIEALDVVPALRKPWRLPRVLSKLVRRSLSGPRLNEKDRTNTRSYGLAERTCAQRDGQT